MSRLVLHYTDSILLMLEQTQTTVLGTYFPLEIDKPFARERMSGPIKEALNTNTLSACLWFGPDYTLFPRALFDPAQLSTYYQLNHGHLASQNHLCFQIIERSQCVKVCLLLGELERLVKRHCMIYLHLPQSQQCVR